MSDRSLRSLARLQDSGATSRVLNLHAVHRQYSHLHPHRAQPFFRTPSLNRALIVKHRLREHERDLFDGYRTNATKVILPIDRDDLSSGGHYVFVGQRGFEAMLNNAIGGGVDTQIDAKTLNLLGQLPSFDPFLLREHLRRFEIHPAACYFNISQADLDRMFTFLQRELRELVEMSMQTDRSNLASSTSALTQKIFSNRVDGDMEPLRLTLRLGREDYLEGVFCWKGFLYYKWKLTELAVGAPELTKQMLSTKWVGKAEPDTAAYIAEARERVVRAIAATQAEVQETISVYDEAYRRLTQAADPISFRNFLLQAPAMFLRLGEKLGVIDHIVSFWTFRFPKGHRNPPQAVELMDMFLDFEESLGLAVHDSGQAWSGAAKVRMIA